MGSEYGIDDYFVRYCVPPIGVHEKAIFSAIIFKGVEKWVEQ